MDTNVFRTRFPALRRTVDGTPAAYLDGPGGTQVHEDVIAAMTGYMERGGANLHGPFVTSEETDVVVEEGRRAVADLFGSQPDEVVFGQNMTSLTYGVSRALARTWSVGDNVVLTRLDHDANVSPWMQAASDAGVEVRFADFDPDDGCSLGASAFAGLLDAGTRLVAFTAASNAVGTITPVADIVAAAHAVGALTYVDAVHYTPHALVDVAAFGTDFLAASAYKWFGPHTGVLFGREELLSTVAPYKLRPAPDTAPDSWETGTQSFESLAGVAAAVDAIAELGEGSTRRERIVDAYRAITGHGRRISDRFLAGLAEIDGVTLFGQPTSDGRTSTFAIDVDGVAPSRVAAELGRRGIFVWSGDYYAYEVMHRLGRPEAGLVRIGFVHYNTSEEVDRVLEGIDEVAIG